MSEDHWQELAACAQANWESAQQVPHNPEVFFPRRADGGQCAPAKRVCGPCPVKAQCLEMGIREPFGVWGGLSEKERREAHRMNKQGMSIPEILSYFDRIQPKRKRKDALPEEVARPHGGTRDIDLSSLIPLQRSAPTAEEIQAMRAAERRRNGL